MARINLLPWRENLRKKKQRDFGIAAFLSVVLVAVACGGVHFYINSLIDNQNKRNNFLKKEIAAMDRKIKEIEELERTKAKLIARMNIIQDLQSSRPQVVHLVDELVNTIPEGAFLTKMNQTGSKILLEGRAQSNARVSAYMCKVDGSKWLEKPNLQVISNKSKTGTGLSHFTLNAQQIVQKNEPVIAAKSKSKKGKKGKSGGKR